MMGTGFLKNLISGKGSEIIESVGNVADKFITTPQEKKEFNAEIQKELNRHTEALISESNKELQMFLADTANARDMNTKIQESDKASWLSKNIAYIIDSVIVLSFITMLVLIYHKAVPEENKELFYTGFGVLGAMLSTVLNFHRGTSKGSENKQKQLDKLSEKSL